MKIALVTVILDIIVSCKAFFPPSLYSNSVLHGKSPSALFSEKAPLKQLQIRYSCDDIDSDEISELLLEVGTLSVSVEVESMRPNVLEDESNWSDLQKQKRCASITTTCKLPFA